MSLRHAERIGAQRPRVANYPDHPFSVAPEAIDLAEEFELYLDDWQGFCLHHGLGQLLDGRWTATKVGVWVPRQNGKGGIIEALILYWLFLTDEPKIIYSAHQDRTAKVTFKRVEALIKNIPEYHEMVKAYRIGNGQLEIELHELTAKGVPRIVQFTTRSATAIRGFSVGKLIFDEAQELDGEQMAALLPTLSAMPGQQSWFFGTPPKDPAAWCYGLKDDGEAGDTPRLAWFDWGIDWVDVETPEGKALVSSVDTWFATNPALGVRIEVDTVEDEHRPSGLGDKFPAERLGMWLPRATGGGVIAKKLWNSLALKKIERPTDQAFAAMVNAKRTHTAIAACGPIEDGRLLVSIVDYRPGTWWLVERMAALRDKWNPVAFAVQDRGPTGSLLPDMAKLGLKPPEDKDRPKRGQLAIPWAADVANAYGLFLDAVNGKRAEAIRAADEDEDAPMRPIVKLAHLDEDALNTSVATTGIRVMSGGTTWDYKADEAAPIQAATLALWAYLTRIELVTATYDALDNFW